VTADYVPSDTNYIGTNIAVGNFVIDRVQSTAELAIGNSPVVYTGAGQTATVSVTSSNTAGTVANILVGGQLSQTNAGTYAVTADYVPSDTNYIGTNVAVGNFVINQATSTATLSVANTPVTYSGSGQTATVSVTSSNTPGAVANILVGGQLSQTNAGSYAVTADYVPTDTNAAILVGLSAGTFTIEKVDATVSADAKSKLYGEANPALTATVTGTLGSDVIHYTLATDATQSSGVGVSNIVVNLESNVNYSVTTHNSTLTINPASGGISLTNLAQSFTGGALAPTVITVPSGLSNSVTYFLPLSLDTNYVYEGMTAAPTNIATYTVIAALQGNYTGRVTNTFVIGQADSTYTNTQTISGSTEITGEVAGPVVVAPNGSVTVSNGTFNAEVTVQDGGSLTVSNSVFNAPVVVQSGGELNTSGSTFSNTVSLQGSTVTADETTFAGPVTVEDGGVIGGSNSEFTAPVTVQDGGTLKGSGTTFRDLVAINDGGTHSPGNSPGVQTFTNGLTYASGSALDWELAANTTGGAGVNYDRVNVTGGNLVIGSNAVINLFFTNGLPSTVDWSDSFWSSNRVWTVIDAASAGSRSGVFALGTVGVDANGLALAAVRGGAYFTVVTQGQNIVLSYTAKTEATVTLTNLSQTYDGAGKPVTAVTSPTNLNVVLTYSGANAAPTNSGSYVVIATVADNNYQGSATNTLVIAKATATAVLAVGNSPEVYTGAGHAATVSVTSSNTPGAVANILTGGAAGQTNAGTYAVTADYVPNDTNYARLTGVGAGNFVISKAVTAVNYGVASFTYDGTAQGPTMGVSGSTGVRTTNYVGSGYVSDYAPTNAGVYTVSNTVASDINYLGATNSQVFTISAKAASVTAVAKSKVYGDANPILTAVTNGAVNGDVINVTLATDATQYSGVGTSNITVTLGSNPNYTVSTTNSTLTINARALGITANNQLKVYGQTFVFTGNEFTATGLTNSDTVTSVTLASAGATNTAAVGSYGITVTNAVGNGLGNYIVSYVAGTLTVAAATPVTLNDPILLSDGSVRLTFNGGSAGISYRIQVNNDLSTAWSTLATNVAGTNGLPPYNDVNATNHAVRFYRTVTP
jgi:hypothetical protein